MDTNNTAVRYHRAPALPLQSWNHVFNLAFGRLSLDYLRSSKTVLVQYYRPLFFRLKVIFIQRVTVYFEDRIVLLKIRTTLLTLNEQRHNLLIRYRPLNLINQLQQSIVPCCCSNSIELFSVSPASLLNFIAIFTDIDFTIGSKIESKVCGFSWRRVHPADHVMSGSKHKIIRDEECRPTITTDSRNIEH